MSARVVSYAIGCLRMLGIASLGILAAPCAGEAPEHPQEEQVSPEPAVDSSAPGVRQVGPNQYEVTIAAFEGGHRPSEIRRPAGSEVTFRAKSDDLLHGFSIVGTSVALELDPNEFAEVKYTFDAPGEYVCQCHVYCGGGHESMRGRIVVEAP